MKKDYFQKKAHTYDNNKSRVTNVNNIANAIIDRVTFNDGMNVMDFGSGTGLLLEKIAPLVKKITAVDISSSMNAQLKEKTILLNCELDIIEVDLTSTDINQRFDVIISSMTLHHIENIEALFIKLYNLLEDNGILALADLDSENGRFHTEDTGVFHFGFDRKKLIDTAKKAGFKQASICTASTIKKPQGQYPVFLLTAHK